MLALITTLLLCLNERAVVVSQESLACQTRASL